MVGLNLQEFFYYDYFNKILSDCNQLYPPNIGYVRMILSKLSASLEKRNSIHGNCIF